MMLGYSSSSNISSLSVACTYSGQFRAFLTYFLNIYQLFLHYFPKNFPFPNYFAVISHLFFMYFSLPNYFLVISPLFLMYFSLPTISHLFLKKFLLFLISWWLFLISQLYFSTISHFLLRLLSYYLVKVWMLSAITCRFEAGKCDSELEIITLHVLNIIAVPDWSCSAFFYG